MRFEELLAMAEAEVERQSGPTRAAFATEREALAVDAAKNAADRAHHDAVMDFCASVGAARQTGRLIECDNEQ